MIKVLVLGPVLNDKSTGGVATISESLVDGFRKLGCEANMVSLERSSHLENIVVGHKRSSSLRVVFALSKIAKVLKKEKPDLVISSLEYNIGIKKFKKASPSTKFVAVIHGMATPVVGKFHRNIVNAVAKYSSKHFDVTSTVSYLSQATNWRFYGIKIGTVIPNGIGDPELFAASEAELKQYRPYDFVYVGRLAKSKRIDLILEAFKQLRALTGKDLRFAVAGNGEFSYLFKDKNAINDSGIEYLGLLPHDQTPRLYKQSKYFISLNELEPLGTVFMEAALSGCNVIHPFTAGESQLFINDPINHFADISSVSALCKSMKEALDLYYQPAISDIERYKEKFSSVEMCKKYLALFDLDSSGVE